jgi:hypothetical protein
MKTVYIRIKAVLSGYKILIPLKPYFSIDAIPL